MAEEQQQQESPVAVTLWDRYLHGLQTQPVLYKAATAATLNGVQEVLATKLTGGKLDSKAAKMAAYGFFVSGPLGHHLYAALEKAFAGKTGPAWGIAKLLASNLIVAPIQNSVYLFAMALIAGQNVQTAIKTVQARLFSVMKTTWVVFPAVQAFAFRFLAPPVWLPFFQAVAFTVGLYINVATKLAVQKKKKSIDAKAKKQ
ncbi:hypothetical protein HDU96_003143 [Phlyctochytrium bullatum]|nr:hypothetical protein HDU96_003143 [Phlyctochytrium bullatum]